MKKLKKISDVLATVELSAAAVLLAALMTISFTQVICRFILHFSIPWAEEGCRFVLIWSCFIAAPVLFSRKKATSVDLLSGLIQEKFHINMNLIIDVIIIGFWAVFGRYSIRLIAKAIASGQLSIIMKIPYAAVYSVMLLSSALCIFHCLYNLLSDLKLGEGE